MMWTHIDHAHEKNKKKNKKKEQNKGENSEADLRPVFIICSNTLTLFKLINLQKVLLQHLHEGINEVPTFSGNSTD